MIDIIGHVTAALSSLAYPSCSARPLEPDLAAALGPERKCQKNSSNEQKYLVQIYI